MPEYIRRPITYVIDPAYDCPFCWKGYKQKGHLVRHIRNCTDNDNSPDEDFDEIILMEENDYTVADYINERDRVVKTIRRYITTNELEELANQTGAQIRHRISNDLAIHVDNISFTWEVYAIFFVMSEEDIALQEEQFADHYEQLINNRYN
jgi:hypothetical protein